jgi:hypothetical protein
MRSLSTSLAMVLALGCSGTNDTERTSRSEQEILGGEVSPSGSDDDAVLLLRANADGEVICTATLVAPNLALTARHCVAYGGPPAFQCTSSGELIPNSWGGGTLGADFPGESIELFSVDERDEPVAIVSSIVSSNTDTICKNDIAYLVLDRDVNLPSRAVRSGVPTSKGETVQLVGYGATVTGQELDYLTQKRKRLSAREVIDVGPDTAGEPILSAPPRSLLLYGPGACTGDSGGPAFSEKTGAIIGVFSILSQGDCSATNLELLYTHTSPFSALTTQAFEVAGAEPSIEPGTGADAAANADSGAQPDSGADAGISSLPDEASESDGACQLGRKPLDPASFLLALGGLFAIARRSSRKDPT